VTGKSAFEWAREAGQLHERGLTIPAQLRFTVAKSILRPLPYMQYVKESTVTEIGEAIERDVAKLPKFPLQLTELPSKPAVYAISPMFDQGRIVALVMYVTQLELSESVLTPEVEAISGQLEEKLPGLCAESELVAYRAFREAPSDPAKNYPYQALVHDCNGSNGRAP
jgi:hypothetical protein